MLDVPTDAALDEARKEATEAVKAAFAESETRLSDQAAARVVKSLGQYFHMEDKVLDRLKSSEKKP